MLQLMAAAVAAVLVTGCGDNIGRAAPDAAPVDAAFDAGPDPLFGAPCPVASYPGVDYPCHYAAPFTPDGWCVQPPGSPSPVCRPMCRDDHGVYCRSIGGQIFRVPESACVCVPFGSVPPGG